jgi:exopolysaccharide biosynthesis WecB/TagA/CpsF family protein
MGEVKTGSASMASVAAAAAPAGEPVRLFGLEVRDTTLDATARWLVSRARHGIRTDVAFLNAHCINVLHRDPAYRRALEAMDAMFADGIGMRIAAKVAGVSLADNVNGTDLFPLMCRQAAADGVGIFMLGARDGIAQAAAEQMQRHVPGLVVSGTQHGYIEGPEHEARIIEAINASGAGIFLVALGVPSQELWMARNRSRLSVPVVIGVGGLFDYYSGRIARAPLPLRRAGLEWAWRLALEPRRLARRYLVGNVEFLARLARAWLGSLATSRRITAP